MRAKISKFVFGLSHDLILESKTALLNKDMDISRLVVYVQQVKDNKKRRLKLGIVKIRSLDFLISVEVSNRVVEIVEMVSEEVRKFLFLLYG